MNKPTRRKGVTL